MSWIINAFVRVTGDKQDLQVFIEDQDRFEMALGSYIETSHLFDGCVLWKWKSCSTLPRDLIKKLSIKHPKLNLEVEVISEELGLFVEYSINNGSQKNLKMEHDKISDWARQTKEEFSDYCDSPEVKQSLIGKYFYQKNLYTEFEYSPSDRTSEKNPNINQNKE